MDDATDGQNLLTKKDVIDFQFAESTLSPKTPFVVACIPAFNEEGTIARVVLMAERFVDPRAHGDALNKWPRSFMVEWSLP